MEKLHPVYSIVAVLLFCGSPGCAPSGKTSTQERNRSIVAGQFEKWQNDEAVFFDLLADDVVWVVSGKSPVSGVYKGKKDFMERAVTPITAQLKTRITPKLISLTTDENYVWLHWKGIATTLTGKSYENHYAWKMRLQNGKIRHATAFLDTYELALLMNSKETVMDKTMEETREYIGMWVTEDGYIRHELLPGNRYDEARSSRKNAYRGSYKVTGNHIDYKDDTGFTADGEFRNGILYHAGMVLYKETEQHKPNDEIPGSK